MLRHNTGTQDGQCSYFIANVLPRLLVQLKIHSSQFHHLFFLPFLLLSQSSCPRPTASLPCWYTPPLHPIRPTLMWWHFSSESMHREQAVEPHRCGGSVFPTRLLCAFRFASPSDFYCICHQVVGWETTTWQGESHWPCGCYVHVGVLHQELSNGG